MLFEPDDDLPKEDSRSSQGILVEDAADGAIDDRDVIEKALIAQLLVSAKLEFDVDFAAKVGTFFWPGWQAPQYAEASEDDVPEDRIETFPIFFGIGKLLHFLS